MKISVEMVRAEELQPGDLFSLFMDAGYWAIAEYKQSVGEKVYIRMAAPCPPEDRGKTVYRIIIEK